MLCTKKPSFEERMKLPLTPLNMDNGYGMGGKEINQEEEEKKKTFGQRI
jgi:hypothetical protein